MGRDGLLKGRVCVVDSAIAKWLGKGKVAVRRVEAEGGDNGGSVD